MKEKNILILLVAANIVVYGAFGICTFMESRSPSANTSVTEVSSSEDAKENTQVTTEAKKKTEAAKEKKTEMAKSTGNTYLDKYNNGVSESVTYENYEADGKYTSSKDRLRNAKDLYSIWDDSEGNSGLLNVIYKGVREGLSSSKKEELKKSELAWIKTRDSDVKGLSGAEKYLKLAQLTKERTKWILDHYS